ILVIFDGSFTPRRRVPSIERGLPKFFVIVVAPVGAVMYLCHDISFKTARCLGGPGIFYGRSCHGIRGLHSRPSRRASITSSMSGSYQPTAREPMFTGRGARPALTAAYQLD